MSLNFIEGKVCLNVLANSLDNAKEIYEVAEKNVAVGVLSASYPTVELAIKDMQQYHKILEGNVSIGLGGGNPKYFQNVIDIARVIKANHYNQVFTAVNGTYEAAQNPEAIINCLVSPSGTIGKVIISTGELSSQAKEKAIVDIETAILMIKDMGGKSVKFFPMKGLACKDELVAVAKACANQDFILEPTGGIDLDNYEEILTTILDQGVKQVIPHIYSSIIDKESGNTKIEDVKRLVEITKKVLATR